MKSIYDFIYVVTGIIILIIEMVYKDQTIMIYHIFIVFIVSFLLILSIFFNQILEILRSDKQDKSDEPHR